MKFLYPGFLWALLLLAIPIIIHLFNFKRYKTLYFSSLSFIKHVDQTTKSTQKLKHILILISRMLAFTFLVISFAQPYFDEASGDQLETDNIYSIYIDNSYSMQSRGSEGELLSEAREKAKELVEQAAENSLFIVNTNDLNGREERILNKAEAIEKIDNIDYSPITRNFSDILSWQNDRLLKDEDTISSIRYLFSDFQKNSIDQLGNTALFGSIYPIQLVPENKDNLYIDSVWYSSPIHQVDQRNELNFKVVNNSPSDLENVEVTISIPPYNKTIYVDVPANSSKTSQVNYTDKTAGVKAGEIAVVDKHVFFDDKLYFSYEVQKEVNILILNGEDQIPNIGIIYELESFYKTVEKDITALTRDDFKDKDLIVINGSNDLSTGLQTFLKEFESTGGSVILFPGTKPNSGNWNSYLAECELPGLGAPITTGTKIKTLEYKDPFFRGVFEKESQNLNLPAIRTVYRPIKTTSPSNELIILQNGLSLFTYRYRKGNVLMFYSSLAEDFGNFSTDALFSTILLRTAERSKRKAPLYLKIGQASTYPLFNRSESESAIHIRSSETDFIPERIDISGVSYLSVKNISDKDNLKADNYDISSDKNLGILSLNYSRNESELTLLTQQEIEDLFTNNPEIEVHYARISSEEPFSTLDIDKPFPYWKICIVITLIFVLTEMLIVRFFK